eukprot:augustus_masked-scaffold_7-processed-gene-13.8-mRNA-1 protein AED:1.00 eAED:1.00 QI:0/-1/0/0/-1/1/1/0/330
MVPKFKVLNKTGLEYFSRFLYEWVEVECEQVNNENFMSKISDGTIPCTLLSKSIFPRNLAFNRTVESADEAKANFKIFFETCRSDLDFPFVFHLTDISKKPLNLASEEHTRVLQTFNFLAQAAVDNNVPVPETIEKLYAFRKKEHLKDALPSTPSMSMEPETFPEPAGNSSVPSPKPNEGDEKPFEKRNSTVVEKEITSSGSEKSSTKPILQKITPSAAAQMNVSTTSLLIKKNMLALALGGSFFIGALFSWILSGLSIPVIPPCELVGTTYVYRLNGYVQASQFLCTPDEFREEGSKILMTVDKVTPEKKVGEKAKPTPDTQTSPQTKT